MAISYKRIVQRALRWWLQPPNHHRVEFAKMHFASQSLRKCCPGTLVQQTSAVIQGITSIVSSWPGQNSNLVIHRTRCPDSVSGHAKGHNKFWSKSLEATVSAHYQSGNTAKSACGEHHLHLTPLKPDGNILWVYGDNRLTLNSSLVQQSCTTEEPEDVLYEVYVAEIFSKINLQDAFLQIPLDDGSRTLTTITTSFGLFAYNFLPFGISVSPSIFQKTTGGIINEIDRVVAFQDDVIVFALDQMSHNQRLSAILDRFIQYNVRINDHKCKFDMNKIDRLGLDLDINGIKPDPGRLSPPVRAI